MADELKTIDEAIRRVRDSIEEPAGAAEIAHHKTLVNFLDGLRGQVKAFCFTWTGAETFDKPKKP